MPSQSVILHSRENGHLHLLAQDNKACQSCQLQPGCGQHLASSMRRARQLVLPETLCPDVAGRDLTQGQQLELTMETAPFLRMALLLYLLPVVVLLLSVLLADKLALSDAAAAMLTVAVLGLGLTCLRQYLSGQSMLQHLQLRLHTGHDVKTTIQTKPNQTKPE